MHRILPKQNIPHTKTLMQIKKKKKKDVDGYNRRLFPYVILSILTPQKETFLGKKTVN